jgi:hypothetical protein
MDVVPDGIEMLADGLIETPEGRPVMFKVMGEEALDHCTLTCIAAEELVCRVGASGLN